ncbi:hypothetical protein HK099_002097, partial [Clydaea vesicula]
EMGMFYKLIETFGKSPYGIPYELSLEILKYLPLQQSLSLGVDGIELEFLVKYNPPYIIKEETKKKNLQRFEKEMNFDKKNMNVEKEEIIFFACHINLFKYYFKFYYEELVSALNFIPTHFCNCGSCKHGPLKALLVKYNCLETLKYLNKNAPEIFSGYHEMLYLACLHNNVECVKFLCSIKPKVYGEANCFDTLAGDTGNLELVKFFTEKTSYPASLNALKSAALNGNLEIVKYLHENRSEGCDTTAIDLAASNGHLEVVKFLFENRNEGCTAFAMDNAAAHGHLDVVKYLVEKNKTCTNAAMDEAAANGHLEVIKFLNENNKNANRALSNAIENNHLNIVTYLSANRKESFSVNSISLALKNKNLEILNYLFKKNKNKNLKVLDLLKIEKPKVYLFLFENILNLNWWECDLEEETLIKLKNFKLDSELDSINEIWREYNYGSPHLKMPSIKTLEQKFGDLWRKKTSNKRIFEKRFFIWKEIEGRICLML